jgi:zinc protease
VRGGHSLDARGLEGTAFLAGKLVDQGTARHSEAELAALLENAGGSLSGSATGIHGSIPNGAWKLLLDCLCECALTPRYPRKEFELQKKRLLDRLLVERDDPHTQGAWLFRRLVYGAHWLGRPEYGASESVARISREQLERHHARSWVASRALIAFCGDVDPRAVAGHLDRALRRMPCGTDLPPPDQRFPALERRSGTFAAERQQVHVHLGHLGIRRNHPDYPALTVMDHVLGTGPGFTSRIAKRLRDELGLCYAVHAAISTSAGVLPGTFTAYIGTSPDKARTAIDGFLAEMRRIRDEPVRAEELELARSYLTGSLVLGYERAGRRVHHMVNAERCGLPQDHLHDLVRRFLEIDAVEVQRVAREHLHPESASLAVAGPIDEARLGI